jgi:nitrite reductase/ring-hydroxylating ferredoxin subunit
MNMAFIRLANVSQVPPDSVIEVMVGDQPYAVCNVGGEVRVLSGICAHRGGPLGQGQIHEGRVICPYHLWEFDCTTGECSFDPDQKVPVFDVTIDNGEILVQAS